MTTNTNSDIGSATQSVLGTITTGTWHGGIIGSNYGGTGVNNGSSTLTLGGNATFSGAFTFAGTLSGNTAITFPTSGTLLTSAGAVTSITGTSNQVAASASTGAVTLSLPSTVKINTSILDSNSAPILSFTATASAVNYITLTNAASGNFPIISAGSPNSNTGLTFVDSSALTLLTLKSDTLNAINYPIMSAQDSGNPAEIVGSTTDGLALKDSSLSSRILVNLSGCSMNSASGDSVSVGSGSATVTGGSSATLSVNIYGGVSVGGSETIIYGPGGFTSTSIVIDNSNQLVMNLNGASYSITFPATQAAGANYALVNNGSGALSWIAPTTISPIQYVQVALSSADIKGMYATPVQMIAAPGSGFMIVIVNASMETLPSGTAYLLGGPVTLQYGNTNHGGGDSATGGTLAAADILGATSTLYTFPLPATSSAYVIATDSNKGIFISNSVAAFSTGTGTAKINITYYVIAV